MGNPSKQTCAPKTLLYVLEIRGKVKAFENNLCGKLNCDGDIPPCFQYGEDEIKQIREELNLSLEEADTRCSAVVAESRRFFSNVFYLKIKDLISN